MSLSFIFIYSNEFNNDLTSRLNLIQLFQSHFETQISNIDGQLFLDFCLSMKGMFGLCKDNDITTSLEYKSEFLFSVCFLSLKRLSFYAQICGKKSEISRNFPYKKSKIWKNNPKLKAHFLSIFEIHENFYR